MQELKQVEAFHVLVPGVTTLKLNLLNWNFFSFVFRRIYISQTKDNPQGNTIRSQRLHRMKIKWTISDFVRRACYDEFIRTRKGENVNFYRDQRAEYPIYMIEQTSGL